MSAPDAVTDRTFIVELDQFSGPLDLLLHLIRDQEIDIADIPIAKIAEQFQGAILDLGLNQAAEYLEMAARLLHIKIQMLLPKPLDDDAWEDPRAELVRRLLEYEQIREVADWLGGRATARAERFGRGWTPVPPEPPAPEIVIDVEGVLRAVEQVVDAMPQPIIHRVVPRPLDVEGATRKIREMIQGRELLDFREIVGPHPHVSDIISALVAVLEMARLGEITLTQQRPLTSFTVHSGSADQTD